MHRKIPFCLALITRTGWERTRVFFQRSWCWGEATPLTFTSPPQHTPPALPLPPAWWLFVSLLLIAITGVPKPDRCLMCEMAVLIRGHACPAASQSRHSSSGITAARLLYPSQRPSNANMLLVPCNLVGFPFNPGFKQGCARRRSQQCIPNAGQRQC